MSVFRFSLSEILNVPLEAAEGALDLSAIEVDFSGGVSERHLDKQDPEEGVFYLNSNPTGHHDAKFCGWTGDKSIVVCVQMRHGLEKSEAELKEQLCVKEEVRKGKAKEETKKDPLFVDALLAIGSGPSTSGAFKDRSLFQRAVRVDGSLFSRPSVLGLVDPAYIVSEEKRLTAKASKR